MNLATVVLFIVFALLDHVYCRVLDKLQYCRADDLSPYSLLGSKTGYEVVRGVNEDLSQTESCVPVKFWSLNRHGTRVAGPDTLLNFKQLPLLKEKIIKNHQSRGTGSLCKKDLKTLKSWKWDESLNDLGNTLTEAGWLELEMIAKRYRNKFPELLRQPYNESMFYFRYTKEQRTEASCKAFVSGLFGNNTENIHLEEPLEDDLIIRPYKDCDAWRSGSKDRPEDLAFEESAVFKQMMSDVSKRLGFKRSLNSTVMASMYDMCRFQKAWQPQEVSPWCAVFTAENLKVLEYLDDLGHFYKSGYGRSINPLVGCTAMKDLVQKFTAYVEDAADVPDVVSYFTHDTMMLLTLTALGVAEDKELLTANNFERMNDRQWRTSNIAAFATNLVAVLYRCNDEEEQFRVQFNLNEKPLNICKGSLNESSQGWCSWDEFLKRFSPNLQCDLSVCNLSKSSPLDLVNSLKRS